MVNTINFMLCAFYHNFFLKYGRNVTAKTIHGMVIIKPLLNQKKIKGWKQLPGN